MRKSLIAAAALLVLFAATLALAHHGPAKVTIKAAQKAQPAVVLDHAKHQTLVKACETCHHTNKWLTLENAANVKVAACSSCHLKAQGKMGTMADASLTKNPLHANCVGCHRTEKKGPVACAGCHVKEQKQTG